jgi:hypothetical protein
MSSLSKIQKNINVYNQNQVITLKRSDYEQQIVNIRMQEKQMYQEKLEHIVEIYANELNNNARVYLDTLLIHIAYELGNQLECFQDEVENKEQKIELIQNILINIQKEIERYNKYKKPSKELQKIKNKLKKFLNIAF